MDFDPPKKQEGEATKAYGLIIDFDPSKKWEGEATKAYGLIADFDPPKKREGKATEAYGLTIDFDPPKKREGEATIAYGLPKEVDPKKKGDEAAKACGLITDSQSYENTRGPNDESIHASTHPTSTKKQQNKAIKPVAKGKESTNVQKAPKQSKSTLGEIIKSALSFQVNTTIYPNNQK